MNTENIMVSVCVQTYQHSNFIKECLDGILLQQTTFPFEIILGEDESTDGTSEICKEYAENYPEKIRLFLRSRKDVIYINEKPTGRYNVIENLKASKGKYIALLEGDDYWTDPLKLQKQVDLLETNPSLVGCHHWQKNAILKDNNYIEIESPKKGHGYYPQPISKVIDIFSNKMRVKTRTVMYRNIIDNHFFPDWFYKVAFGDVPLSFLMGKYGDFGFIDEEMAVYRQTETGVSKAGLTELGVNKFRVQHMKNWIEIWDYANKHYNYKYHKQATQTVTSFYKILVKNVPLRFNEVASIFNYQLFTRKIAFYKTMPTTTWLLRYYSKQFGRKVKRKLGWV